MTESFFDLPSAPEEFGVVLTPPELRRINYTALEWHPLVRAFVEYIKTYFPNEFNNFVTHTGVMMMAELLAYGSSNAALHADMNANEAFISTARSRDSVAQHLALVNRKLKKQTPAVVDVSVLLRNPTQRTISIQPGEIFSVTGPDGKPVFYEIYRTPGDFTSTIDIPPGKSGVIAHGIEGKFEEPLTAVSDGSRGQIITVRDDSILEAPVFVEISSSSGSVEWAKIDAVETAGPNDEVYELRFFSGGMEVVFGDDTTGKAPLSGQTISVRYRVGGGVRGRIGAAAINQRRSVSPEGLAPVEVTFRNPEASSGGQDEESIEVAKRVGPKEAATLRSATTGEDYAVLAQNFSHPIFGSVMKAVATARTELNANLVELHVLAEGPDGIPVTPSAGLKKGLESFFGDIMVLTDEIRVVDGLLQEVDLEMQVTVARSADPKIVADAVDNAVDDFFDPSGRDMGEGLFLAQLYELVQKIDGVRFVSIHSPIDNIYPIDRSSTSIANVVHFNELLVLGEKRIDLFSERDTR